MAQYTKHDLIEKLGEPAEENVKPNLNEPGTTIEVLRWDCGCGAAKSQDDPLWDWDRRDCGQHK
jgi:hypothetical protein